MADIEVIHEEADGHLWHIRYPLADDSGESLIVATTRPETMLGDTAAAVHPEDERYQHLLGKKIRLPITGRIVPLLADAYVDKEFGTGALKITPGHDFNDFEIGERYNLDRISIFDADARVDGAAFLARGEAGSWIERYHGQERFDARKLVVAELADNGLLVKTEAHKLSLGRCYRCQTVIEPYLTPQWFVEYQAAGRTGVASGARRPHQDRSRGLVQFLLRLDGEHQRLVHLSANLVGPSDTRLVLQELRIGEPDAERRRRLSIH